MRLQKNSRVFAAGNSYKRLVDLADRLEVRIVVVDLGVIQLDLVRLLLADLRRVGLLGRLAARHNIPAPAQAKELKQQIGDRHFEEEKSHVRHQKGERKREDKLFQ